MTYLIDCLTPNEKYRWVLRNGEAARVGRSPWVEFCIDDDVELSPEHFLASYTNKLVLHAIDGATMDIDGERITTTTIGACSKVKVGQCVLHFEQLFPLEASSTTVATRRIAAPSQIDRWENKDLIIEQVAISPQGIAAISNCNRPLAAIEALVSKLLLEDAIRLLAGSLPVYPLIQWGVHALSHHKIGTDASVQLLAQSWLNEPSDQVRIEISNRIAWNDNASPWTWILASITWTGDIQNVIGQTQAAATLKTAVATPKMIVSAMIAALQLASCQRDMRSFREHCLSDGIKRLASLPGREGLHASSS